MLLGSDVSHWRPVLDYARYKASGRKFLLFKATDFKDGRWFVDPTYGPNRAGCRAVGLVPGAYLFLREQRTGREQAEHFLRTVGQTQGLILAVDFEHAVATAQDPESNPTPGQLSEAVQTIRAATGRWPWVYTNRGYWNTVGNPRGPSPHLWHAEWRDQMGAMYGGWDAPVCWQYTSTRVVPGIANSSDDNRFFGTEFDLLDHAGSEMPDAQDRGWGPPCPTSSIVNIRVGGRSFNVHRRAAVIFTYFIQELVGRGYRIDEGTLDDWSYVCRHIRNDPSAPWSNHAWGLAVDINSLKNPMRSPLTTDMPAWVRDSDYLMRKYGLRWGGAYVNSTPDPMHFEVMVSPDQADAMSRRLEEEAMSPEDRAWVAEQFAALKEEVVLLYRRLDHGTDEKGFTKYNLKELQEKVEALAAATGVDPAALAEAVAQAVWAPVRKS
jgi:GH25 family lysozyme M1 (1,4-beta-N-acetylmuramidase)